MLIWLSQWLPGRDWMTTMKRVATAGETDDSSERRHLGQEGPATQPASSVWKIQSKLQKVLRKHTARGAQERQRMSTPNRQRLMHSDKRRRALYVYVARHTKIHVVWMNERYGARATIHREQPWWDAGGARHSARNLQGTETQAPCMVQHQWVKWRPASKINEWCRFDEDVNCILEAVMRGGTDRRL